MSRHILLDSSSLGLLSNPANTADVRAITQWSVSCIAAGHSLYVPEVIDYELRRELLRAGKTTGLAKLNSYKATFRYLPITTAAMLRAADLWATARRTGVPTSDPKKLDIDVILAAQALTLGVPAADLVIATSNVSHLSRFVTAEEWRNITALHYASCADQCIIDKGGGTLESLPLSRKENGAMAALELVAEKPPIKLDGDDVFRIGGTRVRLETVIAAFENGLTPEEIQFKYPSLVLADIYAVITYYLQHRGEVDIYLSDRRRLVKDAEEEIESRFPSTGVRERLLARRGISA